MSAGTVFVELDLSYDRFEKNQQKLLQSATSTSTSIEKNFQNLGVKSDAIYEAMRRSAINSFEMIKAKSTSSGNEIIRAQDAMNAKIKAINAEQLGSQTSIINSIKSHWIAASAAIVSAYMLIGQAYSSGKATAQIANDIERQSKLVGIGAEEWQKWGYAAKMSDVSNEALNVGLKMLSKNMEEASKGTGDASLYLRGMGISVRDVHGNLKPLDQTMMAVADKFAMWEDGPRKIAVSLALFGRSGQELIPILNQGSVGIRAYFNEAERLGSVISSELIKKGGEAEAEFKKMESSVSALKTTFGLLLLPTNQWGDAIGGLTKQIVDFYSNPQVEAFMRFITGTIPGLQLFQLPGLLAGPQNIPPYEAGPYSPGAEKKPAPDAFMMLYGQTEEQIKAGIEQAKLLEENWHQWRRAEDKKRELEDAAKTHRGINPFYLSALPEGVMGDWSTIGAEFMTFLPEPTTWQKDFTDFAPNMPSPGFLKVYNQDGSEEVMASAEYVRRVESFAETMAKNAEYWATIEKEIGGAEGWMDMIDRKTPGKGFMRIGGGPVMSTTAYRAEMDRVRQYWDTTAISMGHSLTSNFFNYAESGFKDLEGFVKGFGNSALKVMEELISNALLFGQITGGKGGTSFFGTSKSGYGGLVGGVLKLFGLAEGGVMDASFHPFHAYAGGGVANGPQFGLFGEGGPEAFVPLRNGKIPVEGGKGQTIIYNDNRVSISAIDTQSMDEALRKKGRGAILGITRDDARGAGISRNTIRSYG